MDPRLCLVVVLAVTTAGCHWLAPFGASPADGAPADAGTSDGWRQDVGARDVGAFDDAPADDAPADDAPADQAIASPTICAQPPPNTVFCTGFEDPAFAGMSKEEIDGTVSKDTRQPYRGKGALHAVTTSANGQAALCTCDGSGAPIKAGELHARAYFYVPSGIDFFDTALLIIGEHSPPWGQVNFSIHSRDQLGLWVGDDDDGVFEQAVVQSFFDRWVCVRLSIDIADAGGSASLYIDDVLVARAEDTDTLPSGGYTDLAVGIAWTDPKDPPAEVWVDELIVSTTPVLCD